MVLLIDNYDSFTYIIVQYLQQLHQDVVVHFNDTITLKQIATLSPKAIVIGPGPGRPEDAGISLDIIDNFAGQIPILGICLGHQAIAMAYGAKIIQAAQIMHGRVSAIYHRRQGVFTGLPSPINMTRYHSLVIDKSTLPDTLEITGWTQPSLSLNTPNECDGEDIVNKVSVNKISTIKNSANKISDNKDINDQLAYIEDIMAIRHKSLAVQGVQFHPESILSDAGLKLLDNFLRSCE